MVVMIETEAMVETERVAQAGATAAVASEVPKGAPTTYTTNRTMTAEMIMIAGMINGMMTEREATARIVILIMNIKVYHTLATRTWTGLTVCVKFALITLITLLCFTMQNRSIPSNEVSVMSWNLMCNFSCAKPLLNEMMQTADIMVISEHGLFECELHKLHNFDRNFKCFPKSSRRNKDINLGKLRGIGGCAIFWRTELDNIVRPLPEMGDDRICVVQLTVDTSLYYIIAVYMPHQTCKIDNFENELAKLQSIIVECSAKSHGVIVIGDCNAHIGADLNIGPCSERLWGRSTKSGKLFYSTMTSCDLDIVDIGCKGTGSVYTYRSGDGLHFSYIDHCAVSFDLVSRVRKCNVLSDSINNTSDHLPMKLTMDLSIHKKIDSISPDRLQIAWHKVNETEVQEKYTRPLETYIQSFAIEFDGESLMSDSIVSTNEIIESVLGKTTQAILTCSSALPRSKYNKSLKPYWTQNLNEISKEKKSAYRCWVNSGQSREPGNADYMKYKEAKRKFRREQRKRVVEFETECMKNLSQSQEMDQKHFWHLVNSNKKRSVFSPIQNEDGNLLTEEADISKEWSVYYKELFSDKQDINWDCDFKMEIEREMEKIDRVTPVELDGGPILVEEIETEINKLKKKKAPGWDCVTAEHIIYGGEHLKRVLTWLMNAIL